MKLLPPGSPPSVIVQQRTLERTSTHHESGRVADGVVLAGEALEDAIYRGLALGAGDLVVPGLAPKQAQHCQKERHPSAVIEVLHTAGRGDK